ncbi:MAG TPA: glycoside hydrolase family 2 TIM barrel-domain containing protein [Verrucomicrobiae bacterium]|nr:glycoside hydrolase family 2 TIM barrel-domain containing protein [Verrucomicrobiae bacterium]
MFGDLAQSNENFVQLQNGWRVQSSSLVTASGAAISVTGFDASNWRVATVPSTVLATLVDDGIYTNIFFGTNLARISTSPFTNSWWFRKTFDLSHGQAEENTDLVFDGINYRANVWLNGKQIAAADKTFGAFRTFKFDVTGKFKSGKNVLAVEVFPPQPGDFTMGFVDWNPTPPDHEMGLFRPVKLHFYKTVALENVFVETKIDHRNWRDAQLTIHADLSNHSRRPVKTMVRGEIGNVSFSEQFALQAGETRAITFVPENHPELNFKNAKLWWPWELGEPHLYEMKLTAESDRGVFDTERVHFGIREVADDINADGDREYMVNGKKILIRGGGWADELLLRESEKNLRAQIAYTKAMNLNTIRLEGFWGESQRLYDLADESGLLVMVGFSCQWEWKDYLEKDFDETFGGFVSEAEMNLATNYLHDQVLWLRNHPSIFVWVLGSDKLPRPELEARYDALLKQIDPTRPTLKSCASVTSSISGPSAVKMNGPYDYVTPDYWYLDKTNGGAFGFNTETSPGPEPPPLESLRRMIPAGHLWPIDSVWNFHCGRYEFGQMSRYLNAFTNRYNAPKSIAEFAFKSQAANYEGIRAMFEAFAVNLSHTTGIIQWMLNPSWPRFYWQLYDYYLVPGGAFFGAKKGATPFAVIYNYGDKGIYLVNQTCRNPGDCRTTVTVYNLNSKKILEQTVTNAVPVYGSEKIFDLSKLEPDTPVYFLDLHTIAATGSEASADNFYWLSTKPDVLDEDKSTWFVTPNKSFADFRALNQMPEANVRASVSYAPDTNGTAATVTLENSSNTLAFFIEMRIVDKKSQQSLTPVFWDDNYVSLPPHAVKTFHALIPASGQLELKLNGWNVKFESVVMGSVPKL